jgi:hypothetical protein
VVHVRTLPEGEIHAEVIVLQCSDFFGGRGTPRARAWFAWRFFCACADRRCVWCLHGAREARRARGGAGREQGSFTAAWWSMQTGRSSALPKEPRTRTMVMKRVTSIEAMPGTAHVEEARDA